MPPPPLIKARACGQQTSTRPSPRSRCTRAPSTGSLADIGDPFTVLSVQFHPTEMLCCTASGDTTVQLWRAPPRPTRRDKEQDNIVGVCRPLAGADSRQLDAAELNPAMLVKESQLVLKGK